VDQWLSRCQPIIAGTGVRGPTDQAQRTRGELAGGNCRPARRRSASLCGAALFALPDRHPRIATDLGLSDVRLAPQQEAVDVAVVAAGWPRRAKLQRANELRT
jgi:hypothetical protein